jgi:formylglycine-generating enzyme required for sulfatase activity
MRVGQQLATFETALAALCVAFVAQSAQAAVDFAREIKPLIESTCLRCHNEYEAEGGLRLDSLAAATSEELGAAAIVAGNPDESPFYQRLLLPADDPQAMPPGGPMLAPSQLQVVRGWIAAGAPWPDEMKLETQPRIDFVEHVQPILEIYCLSCHGGEHAEGDLDLTTSRSAARYADLLVPFAPEESLLFTTSSAAPDDAQLMPPADQGGPLAKDSIEILRLWIAQGAVWPEELTLTVRPKPAVQVPSPDDMQLVRRIHAKIVATARDEASAAMEDYEAEVPLTEAPYEMIALDGGSFMMGSPAAEPGRGDEEGPQTEVEVAPFWIGKYEVTWDEYEPFMLTGITRLKNGMRKDFDPAVHTDVDAVSQPTTPYVEMSFGMGQYGYPAISMTQHGANKYCQWLSAQTGRFYRLPTEAEWEYACRAGSATAYSFGDDAGQLDDYAWHAGNSEEKYQLVGQKEPNAWGLYDMHGNVAEWTADQYVPDYFNRLAKGAANPFVRPTTLYPRSVRGGGWADAPGRLRSAARRGSESLWQQQDPQLPKSQWYLTDAPWLGFRLVRPREIPSVEEMYFYWNSSSNKQ